MIKIRRQCHILEIPVDLVTMREAINQVENFLDKKKSAVIATANAEMIMQAQNDLELKKILQQADLVVPDGAGTVWAAQHLGYAMKERVAGYDLMQEILKQIATSNRREKIYFLGAAPNIAKLAQKKIQEKFPNLNIVGTHDGFFDDDEEKKIIQELIEKKVNVLFVALGVPKQEKFIFKLKNKLTECVFMGVGGSFDVMAGHVKRAPKFIQQARLEWLFRALLQPKRAKRLVVLPKFVWKIFQHKK